MECMYCDGSGFIEVITFDYEDSFVDFYLCPFCKGAGELEFNEHISFIVHIKNKIERIWVGR